MERKVLVTGASKGIGQAIAQQLAMDGFHVVIHYHTDKQGAENTLRYIENQHARAQIIQFDIADREHTRSILEKHMEAHGAFYGIVNNAGIIKDAAFPALTDGDWDNVIHTNLDGFYNVIHPCLMPMIRLKNGGRIITLSSVSGIMGNRGQTNYSAAKAGIIGATKALAVELASRKITVNCIAPGLIDTGIFDMAEEAKQESLHMIPMKRMGTVSEVAALASFLMSDSASYITRQVISVNGGML